MTHAAWYLRRAVPWTALSGCLAAGVLLVALVHRWDSLAGLAIPLVILLAGAAAAFLFDDPARPVTAVAPRGGRWAGLARLGLAALPVAGGLVLLLAAPEVGRLSEWMLVLVGLAGVVLTLAELGARRQVAHPGPPIASAVVLVGLAPFVLGAMLDLRSPYPAPDLGAGLTWFWSLAAVCGWLAATSLAMADAPARNLVRGGWR